MGIFDWFPTFSITGGKMETSEMYRVVLTKGQRRKHLGEKSETELYGYLNERPLTHFAPGDVLARLVLRDSLVIFVGERRCERVEITRVLKADR
jgi:hypothetical protein